MIEIFPSSHSLLLSFSFPPATTRKTPPPITHRHAPNKQQQAQARGVDEDDEEAKEYFDAILRACNELTAEIAFVQEQMSPCFPPNWALEMLWSTCVAHVCSTQILEQIGGKEGHKLPNFETMQLLDLVAWIESFRSTIEETFPNIWAHISEKTYFDKKPDLLQEDNRQIDMDVAKDSLAWANKMLWEVHDLSRDEFLYRTNDQFNEWLDNVYEYVVFVFVFVALRCGAVRCFCCSRNIFRREPRCMDPFPFHSTP